MRCPIINPVRFYDKTAPNWSTVWPNIDNMQQRVQYFNGIYPGEFYKDFIQGEEIKLQFEHDSLDHLFAYKWNQLTNSFERVSEHIPVYITPSGWVGENTIYFEINLNAGLYYLQFQDGFKSDKFIVHSDLELKKKLIRINYYNSENDYGAIFNNNDIIVYSPVTFFTGKLDSGSLENEMSTFETDRGNLIKLRSTPKRIQTLTISDVHKSYLDNINLIFSCDYININGVEYQTSEPPVIEEIENFDICTVTVKLLMNNSYFYANN